MTKPAITKRSVKGAALTYNELDTNFQNLADATVTLTAGSGGTAVTSDLNGNITLVAGSGISLSGNNTSKEITITSTSATNTFSTIAVSGQSNVVADSTSDTLTLVAGSNITLTTNATTDAITIAAAGSGLTSNIISVGAADSTLVQINANNSGITKGIQITADNNVGATGLMRLGADGVDSYLQAGGGGDLYVQATTGNLYLSGVTVNVGPITSVGTAGTSSLDRSGSATSYANGATVNFSNFSGMVMINRQDASSGNVALWLCGGGVATKLGDSQADVSGTISGNGAVNGYTWTNNTGTTIICSFMLFRGRTSG